MIPFLVNGILFGSVIGLLALAYAISFWPSRQFHFAFSSVLLASAYALYFTSDPLGWPPAIAALVSVVVAMVVGVGVYAFLYRPLKQPSAVLLTALGFTIVFQNFVNLSFGTAFHRINQTDFATSPLQFPLDVHVAVVQVGELLTCAALAAGLVIFIRRSRTGIAIRALSSDPFLTETVGIDAHRMNLFVYALGSAVGAVGMMFLVFDAGVNPDVATNPLFYALNGVIIGGIRSFAGAVAGGLLLGVFMNVGIWQLPSQWQTTIAFGLLMIVVLFRPNGLFSSRS
jgi:branched-chain amino acid transport system permease protein